MDLKTPISDSVNQKRTKKRVPTPRLKISNDKMFEDLEMDAPENTEDPKPEPKSNIPLTAE